MRRIGAIAIVLLFALWAGMAFAQSDSAIPAPYVYRLKIGNCTFDPTDRRQTGFRVQGRIGIVTALHGVADCKTISAVADNGQELFNDLVIEQVDIERDIALLVSSELAQKSSDGLALSTLTASEILTTPLSIVGYPLGLDQQDIDSNLLVRDVESLDAVIPDPEETEAFRLRHSPALTITVLNIQAQLLPGHSGAPLLDPENRLVGVGNGGLRGGTVNRSWAIPWSAVRLQPITLPQIKQQLTALLATEPGLALAFSSTYPEQVTSSTKLVKFTGWIVDQQTNKGIGNTEVLLVFDRAGEYRVSYSDPRGFFVFEFAPSKERAVGTIAIEAVGYEYQLLPVELGAVRNLGRIPLQELPPTPTSEPISLPTPTLEPTTTPTPTTAEFDNYQFSLQGCVLSGETLTCTILISNQAETSRLMTMANGGNARIIDVEGNEYQHKKLCIGTECGNGLYSGINFPPDVPLKAIITFEPVAHSIKGIAVLEIITWDMRVALQNIQVSGTSQEAVSIQLPEISSTVVQNITFSIEECVGMGERVECTFHVTNLNEIDEIISTSNGGNARFIDDNGNEYRHSYMAIGNATGSNLYSGVYLISKVPVKSVIRFDKVPPSVTKISLLEIKMWDFTVSLPDIPVSR